MDAITAQFIGLVAMFVGIAAYQQRTRRRILLLQIVSPLLWMAHFGILGAWTGLALNGVGMLRAVTFFKLDGKKRQAAVPAIFIGLCVAVVVITWQGSISLLPLLGMMTGTLALWQKNPRHIRMLALAAPPAWFTYNFLVGSYPGMLNEAIVFCSILVGMYRFDIRNSLAKNKKGKLSPKMENAS